MPYKFLEDISIADVAVEVTSNSFEALLVDAAKALAATQIKNVEEVRSKIKKKIIIKGKNEEELLFKFLEELIFLKDRDLVIFTKFKEPKLEHSKKELIFSCIAEGEKIDFKKHISLVDVKAITMHLFEVKKRRTGWKARFVLDV